MPCCRQRKSMTFAYGKRNVSAATDQNSPIETEPRRSEEPVAPGPLPESPPPIETQPAEPSWWGLRRGDVVLGTILVVICFAFTAWHWVRLSGWGLREIEIERPAAKVFEYRLDVNSATWVEWMQLPGIGETLARRIVEDRETHGPFESIEDVQRVKGIGVKTLAKLRPWLTLKK